MASEISSFLDTMTKVDFHVQEPDPMNQLIWGITGKRNINMFPPFIQLEGRRKASDVFMCYRDIDKFFVRKIGEQLIEYGISPWLDEWELRPGLPWNSIMEQGIETCKSAAVFIGENGLDSWQQQILNILFRQLIRRNMIIIPVILPGVVGHPQLPIFLESLRWVDFRSQISDPIQQLVSGVSRSDII